MIFQITALPRSGTAFVAAFLNLHPECFCHHDLAADRDDWKEHSDFLNKKWEFVGEVSTYGWLPRAHRPDGPKVYIKRDPTEVKKSVEKIMGNRTELDVYIRAAEAALEWAQKHNALVIDFKRLFTLDALGLIWDHVFTGSFHPFPVDKARLALTMNTQRQDPKKAFGDARYVRQRLLTPDPCTVSKP